MTAPNRTLSTESAANAAASIAVSDPKFWAKVVHDPRGFCQLWTGYRDRQGYGLVSRKAVAPSPMLAHRYAYFLTRGELPVGAVIRHACDNPPCVEPTHLLIGTQADNIADRQARGRHRPGRLHGVAHPASKLDDDDVLWVRRAWRERRWSQADMARYLQVHISTIHRITSGHGWKHLRDVA